MSILRMLGLDSRTLSCLISIDNLKQKMELYFDTMKDYFKMLY